MVSDTGGVGSDVGFSIPRFWRDVDIRTVAGQKIKADLVGIFFLSEGKNLRSSRLSEWFSIEMMLSIRSEDKILRFLEKSLPEFLT